MKKPIENIMISGASGYFGGICRKYFERTGRKVFTAGRSEESDVYMDLQSPESFVAKKFDQKIDLFIHSAAANENICAQRPCDSYSINVVGTRAIMDFCAVNSISKVVYLSTFHVFDNPADLITEDIIPNPSNDYGLTHYQAEQIVKLLGMKYSIKTTILRPSNIYGVPVDIGRCDRWSLVTLGFCRDAVCRGQIVLKTPGLQKRNFVSAGDVCRSIEKSIDLNSVMHVFGLDTLSIRDLAFEIKHIMETRFGRGVSVTTSDGTQEINDFDFSSKYEVFRPTDRIADYIESMCRLLIEEKEKGV